MAIERVVTEKEKKARRRGKRMRRASLIFLILAAVSFAAVFGMSLLDRNGKLPMTDRELVEWALLRADPKDLFELTGRNDAPYENTRTLDVWNVALYTDTKAPGIVRYECEVAGLPNAVFSMLYGKALRGTSDSVTMSGVVRVEKTDEGTRLRYESGNDVFGLLTELYAIGSEGELTDPDVARYYLQGKTTQARSRATTIASNRRKDSKGITLNGIEKEVVNVINDAVNESYKTCANEALTAYLRYADTDEVTHSMEYLGSYTGHLSQLQPKEGSGATLIESVERLANKGNMYMCAAVLLCALSCIMCVLLLVLSVIPSMRAARIEEDERVKTVERHVELGRELDVYKEVRIRERNERELKQRVEKSNRESAEDVTERIRLTKEPTRSDEMLRTLNSDFQAALKAPHNEALVTKGGWALMALMCGMLSGYRVEQEKENDEKVQAIIGELTELETKRNGLVDRLLSKYSVMGGKLSERDLVYDDRPLLDAIKRYDNELKNDILLRCIEKKCVPLTYFERLASDRHIGARFINQCALAAMLPWAREHAGDGERYSEMARRLGERRDAMINSADSMAFFEVRAPRDCGAEAYARILGDVLRLADDEAEYCDLEQMMTLAQEKIPGVMELLYDYPLRIIDARNAGTLGFYQFKPYRHTMWVNYMGEENRGEVIRRYHEAIDMTVPNASGVNLALFFDPYAPIPTLFHEHCHYRGDHNEASVFLRTQLFSQELYSEYDDSDPMSDDVFVTLQTMLGQPPKKEKRGELNQFIEKLYGKRGTEKEAKETAEKSVADVNLRVAFINQTLTWGPDKKFPLLGHGEDQDGYSYDVLIESQKRFITMPRSLEEGEFDTIVNGESIDESVPAEEEIRLPDDLTLVMKKVLIWCETTKYIAEALRKAGVEVIEADQSQYEAVLDLMISDPSYDCFILSNGGAGYTTAGSLVQVTRDHLKDEARPVVVEVLDDRDDEVNRAKSEFPGIRSRTDDAAEVARAVVKARLNLGLDMYGNKK